MSVPDIPVVLLFGTAYERGQLHGQRFQTEIEIALRHRFKGIAPSELLQARERAKDALCAIRSLASETVEEMQGIADGSGQELVDIVLRCSFELLPAKVETGCSAIAARSHNGAIVAQNWDAPPETLSELILFLHVAPDGFEYAVVASHGGLVWVGMNKFGLGVVNNDLILRSRKDGIPSQIVRRIMLTKHSTSSAVQALAALPHMAGRSYVLGDSDGNIAAAEVSAEAGTFLLHDSDYLSHTNHSLHDRIQYDEDTQQLLKQYPSTYARLHALQRTREADPDVETFMDILRDQEGTPDSVCKTMSAEEPTQTVFSIIMHCGLSELYLSRGRPSETEYQKISLPTGL